MPHVRSDGGEHRFKLWYSGLTMPVISTSGEQCLQSLRIVYRNSLVRSQTLAPDVVLSLFEVARGKALVTAMLEFSAELGRGAVLTLGNISRSASPVRHIARVTTAVFGISRNDAAGLPGL